MIKYMSYLFVLIRKRLSTYLIPLFSLVASCGLMYLTFNLANKNGQSGVGGLSPFFLFIPFIFGGLFTGVKALNIFKDGEIDGTELLIASKQITRTQLVLGKFATLYTLIIGYNIVMFIGATGVAFADQYASTSDVFLFSGSFAIGGLIIMTLMAAIIAFFASFLGKIGTMTLSIILPALLPIVSFMINPMGSGTLDLSAQSGDWTDYQLNYHNGAFLKDDGTTYTQAASGIYSVDESRQADIASKVKAQADGWYKYAAYADIYQHLNRFYNILEPTTINPDTQAAQWKYVTLDLEKAGATAITDKSGKKYYISISDKLTLGKEIINGIDVVNAIDFGAFDTWANTHVTKTADQGILSNFELSIQDLKTQIDPYQKDLDNATKEILAVRYYAKYYQGESDEVKWDNTKGDANGQHILQIANPNTKFLEGKRYISTSGVLGVYIAITILLSGLVIFRYYRRDFK